MPNDKLADYGLNIKDIEVKTKIIENQSLKAIIGLDFGPFTVKGFRISKSKYVPDSSEASKEGELWIVPPSYKDSGGRYHPTFFIPNKELWAELKDHIMKEYEKAVDAHYKKRFNMPEL